MKKTKTAVAPKPATTADPKHQQIMGDPSQWTSWPMLSIKRGKEEGVLVDIANVGGRTTVFLTNPTTLSVHLVNGVLDVKSFKKIEYKSVDAIITDGWRVES